MSLHGANLAGLVLFDFTAAHDYRPDESDDPITSPVYDPKIGS